jgi:predicted transcriptional regulator
MERNEISIHEARVYKAFVDNGERWVTSKELSVIAQVAERTARAHARKLTLLGIVDLAEVFPAHRYRLSSKASKRNKGYAQRLAAACEVMGV